MPGPAFQRAARKRMRQNPPRGVPRGGFNRSCNFPAELGQGPVLAIVFPFGALCRNRDTDDGFSLKQQVRFATISGNRPEGGQIGLPLGRAIKAGSIDQDPKVGRHIAATMVG